MERIGQYYGNNLNAIEKNINRILNDYFFDGDGFIYSYINKNTFLPFQDEDPEVNVVPVWENWIARGAFPDDLKLTYITYEDSCMSAGDYLMALMSKYAITEQPETKKDADGFFKIMTEFHDTVSKKNPYGAGFLPKPYGGINRAHESFETSADQYFKFSVALEKYSDFTGDGKAVQKSREILVSFARWLDERDFVTPYMGYCNYGRLQHLQHYLGYFAYIMALGYRITGSTHYRREANFFMDRMLEKGKLSQSPNSLNLVIEILDRLIDLMPEYKKEWLELMMKNWDNRKNHVDENGISCSGGYTWNFAARQLSTYNTVARYFNAEKDRLDSRKILLTNNSMHGFVHLLRVDKPENTMFYEHRFCLSSQSYACWLRGYWESDLNRKVENNVLEGQDA